MRKRLVAAVAAVAGVALAAGAAHPAPAATAQHVAVPAYFYPGDAWTRLTAGGVGMAIANPDSGPGTSADQSYASAVKAAHDAGVKVIGYVDTGYFGTTGSATRDGRTSTAAWTAQAEADVDAWYSFYGAGGLDGIFFDDALADCGTNDEHVNLYVAIADYVRQRHPGATVVDNPGTGAEQCYTRAADTLVTFENTYAAYESWQPPAWEASADPDRIWHLVYATPGQADMENAMSLAKSRNAGYVYVTPDDLPNPWDTLPSGDYWSTELARAAG